MVAYSVHTPRTPRTPHTPDVLVSNGRWCVMVLDVNLTFVVLIMINVLVPPRLVMINVLVKED